MPKGIYQHKPLSEVHKKNIGLAHLGKHCHTEESKRKIGLAHLGKKLSKETKYKLSLSHLGKPSWNKGKPCSEEIKLKLQNSWTKEKRMKMSLKLIGNKNGIGNKSGTGKKLSEVHKKNIGLAHLGKHCHTEESKRKIGLAHLGKKLSKETKYKLSLSQKGRRQSKEEIEKRVKSNTGKKRSETAIQNLKNSWTEERRKKRLQQIIPKKDTKPEKMMQLALQLNGIKFETHKPIIGQPDIFIEPNLCIFIDGDYWHANPKKYKADDIIIGNQTALDILIRDSKINHELNKQGYSIMRFWESDIKNNINNCSSKIILGIKKLGLEEIKN